jgi:hypothetical protein
MKASEPQEEKAEKKAAKPQEEKKEEKKEEKGEIHYLKPAVWHVVNVPTRGLYRFQDQELVRVINGTLQLISKMSMERHSQASLIELFEYLDEKPYVLVVHPSLGRFIQGEIGIIKPIIEAHEARLAEMTKMLGASMDKKYGVYQEKVDKWLHLKSIMGHLERIATSG